MRRVVVTGFGILCSLGLNRVEVKANLFEGRPGIVHEPEYAEKGFRSHVCGPVNIDLTEAIHRKQKRFMGDSAAYCTLAMHQAIEHAGLEESDISNPRTGIVVGIGGSSTKDVHESIQTHIRRGHRRVGPYYVPRTMASGVPANLATIFKIKGVNYSMSSACATSATCIGHAGELIQMGKQDVVLAGGGEELHWVQTMMFDAMGALSSKYNDNPGTASRAYDANRDGFVISAGGGIVVLENYEHAKARGATIYAELTGYGATSDGADMVAPSGEGAVRCMQIARGTAKGPIQYINTHGTSTPAGDITELNAIREVFGDTMPHISSTKSLSGHALGGAGVNEAIYCLVMMQENFITASANIETLDKEAEGAPIVRERIDNAGLERVMSNSFGFGGTNACLVFERV